jgi:hypothetical protein
LRTCRRHCAPRSRRPCRIGRGGRRPATSRQLCRDRRSAEQRCTEGHIRPPRPPGAPRAAKARPQAPLLPRTPIRRQARNLLHHSIICRALLKLCPYAITQSRAYLRPKRHLAPLPGVALRNLPTSALARRRRLSRAVRFRQSGSILGPPCGSDSAYLSAPAQRESIQIRICPRDGSPNLLQRGAFARCR